MKSWKTTLGGILGALGLAMKHDARVAAYSDTVTALGLLLVGSAARDNNVTSEQAGATTSVPPAIKAIIGAVLVGLFATGCVTGPTGTQTLDVARVARLSSTAAQLGTQVYLTSHPGDRVYFDAARNALTALDKTGNYDPVAFANALKALPIKELRSSEGAIIVDVAIVAWQELSIEATKLDNTSWVQPVLIAVRDGIGRALDATAPK